MPLHPQSRGTLEETLAGSLAARVSLRPTRGSSYRGMEKDVQPNTVDAFIRPVRSKVDSGRRRPLIQTVRGYGYILREEM
jgi:DNA-binding response OmpR family regulator